MDTPIADLRHNEVQILSGKDGRYEAPAELIDKVAFTSEGILYIADSARVDIEVIEYRELLKARGALSHERDKVKYVSLAEIKRLNGRSPAALEPTTEQEKDTFSQQTTQRLLEEAKRKRASDIHIIEEADRTEVLFRILGRLVHQFYETQERGLRLIRTIYNGMCEIPDEGWNGLADQNARFKAQYTDAIGLDQCRVATGPIDTGHVMAVRLHYPLGDKPKSMGELGWLDDQVVIFNEICRRRRGIFVLSGETGAGKTTTLAHLLWKLLIDSNYSKSLVRVADPPELYFKGARNKAVPIHSGNPEAEARAWESVLDTILRWDPDLVEITELRLRSAMYAAIRSALASHLTFGSIHAADCCVALSRLEEAGVEPRYLTDETMFIGLANQSLVASLCPKCSRPFQEAKAELDVGLVDRVEQFCIPDQVRVRGHRDDCDVCFGAGAIDRRAVGEIVMPDRGFMAAYKAGGSQEARQYFRGVMKGVTKHQAMIRVINQGEVDPSDAEIDILGLDEDI